MGPIEDRAQRFQLIRRYDVIARTIPLEDNHIQERGLAFGRFRDFTMQHAPIRRRRPIRALQIQEVQVKLAGLPVDLAGWRLDLCHGTNYPQ
jgi:hypothetical protein